MQAILAKYSNIQCCIHFYLYWNVCIFYTSQWPKASCFQVLGWIETSFGIVNVGWWNASYLSSTLYYHYWRSYKVQNAKESKCLQPTMVKIQKHHVFMCFVSKVTGFWGMLNTITMLQCQILLPICFSRLEQTSNAITFLWWWNCCVSSRRWRNFQ